MLLFQDAGGKGVGVVVSEDRDDGLYDYWSGIDATVDKVDCATGKACTVIKRLLLYMQPWKSRQQGRMDVDDTFGKSIDESLRDDAHEACQDNQLNTGLLQRFDDRRVKLFTFGEVAVVDAECRHPGLACPVESPGVGVVGDNDGDLGSEAAVRTSIDDRLQVSAAARLLPAASYQPPVLNQLHLVELVFAGGDFAYDVSFFVEAMQTGKDVLR